MPAPWTATELEESFSIRDANGQQIAYVYFDSRQNPSSLNPRLTKDEARRVAANIAKLPDLLRKTP